MLSVKISLYSNLSERWLCKKGNFSSSVYNDSSIYDFLKEYEVEEESVIDLN